MKIQELFLVELAPEETKPVAQPSSGGAHMAAAPLGQLQPVLSWGFRCQREDERRLFLPLEDVCPFPVASRTRVLVCPPAHSWCSLTS